jgi:hypothetical protein
VRNCAAVGTNQICYGRPAVNQHSTDATTYKFPAGSHMRTQADGWDADADSLAYHFLVDGNDASGQQADRSFNWNAGTVDDGVPIPRATERLWAAGWPLALGLRADASRTPGLTRDRRRCGRDRG